MANIDIDKLMEAAGGRLGIAPEKLREMLSSGDYSDITARLSPKDREKINAVLNSKELSEKFRKQFM